MKNFNTYLKEISKYNKNIAVIDEKNSFSFEELYNIANFFCKSCKIKNENIGLFFEKSSLYIASLYTVTLSKNSFIPLDKNLPEERLSTISSEAEISYFITSNKYKLPEFLLSKKIIYIEDLIKKSNDLKSTNKDYTFKNKESDRAYIIYTSGSTGKPKGVELTYSGLYNVIHQQINIFDLKKSKSFLYLSISFDASLSDIYCSLLSNSTLYINEKVKNNINEFIEYINNNKITHIDLPPSILKLIPPYKLNTIKTIVVGGEVANPDIIREYQSYFKIVNVYGPTEATICTSYSICSENWNEPLIGEPLNNVYYSIHDCFGNEIKEKNKIGELYIKGISLAKGYYKNEKLTQEKFISISEELYYKTGDFVFINDNNLFEFSGRIDKQVKVNGNLISLEEIEFNLNNIKGLINCSVVFENNKITAFVEGNIEKNTIIKKLKEKIPNYMIPKEIIYFKEIPKTITGKNDSKLLQSLCNTLEYSIFKEFEIILNKTLEYDVNKTFIDYGADSLDLMELQVFLEKHNINMDFEELWLNSSIAFILKNKKNDFNNNFNLKEECKKHSLQYINNNKYIDSKNKNILLTGSTGFLGSWVLSGLLKRKDIKNIYCILRNEKTINDIINQFDYLKINYSKELLLKKIKIISADISFSNFNLPINKWKSLCNKIDIVYHCAGEVNNLKPYSELIDSNINSVKNVLLFLNEGKSKILNYASTLSVFVSREHDDNEFFFENDIEFENFNFFTGYSQSKWVSEFIVSLFKNQGANINIFRYGLLTGDSYNGILSKNTYLEKVIKIIKNSDKFYYDEENLSFDYTPVNIAADFTVINGLINNNSIFNVSLNKKIYLNDLFFLLKKNATFINKKEWKRKNPNNQRYFDSDLHKNMNLFEMKNVGGFFNKKFNDFYLKSNYNINIEKMISKL